MLLRLAAVGCVLLLATGQLVFKSAADAGVEAGTFFAPRPLLITFGALSIYGIASILWILLLQHSPIAGVYPFMALAFIIVPVLAHFVLGETLGMRNLLGGVVIAAGVVISVSA